MLIGQIVNSYRVLEKLGAGGMGVVYKAVDIKLSRTVALKFLPAEASLEEHARAQLLDEARAASVLDHPNIGTIHGIEEDAHGHVFIVVAYYEGVTQDHARAAARRRSDFDRRANGPRTRRSPFP